MRHRHGLLPLLLLAGFFLPACKPPPTSDAPPPSATAIADRLGTDFARILTATEELAATTAGLYDRRAEILARVDRTPYGFAPDGSFYRKDDKAAALWISGAVAITPEVQEMAYLTEPLDPELMRVCRELPVVVQAYYNDKHSLNRIYPWMDAISQYEPRMNIPEYNFYYLADAAHNPSRRGVWVADPYVDPAGRGWMISAIAPVYHQEQLQGVVGLDVTIETLLRHYVENTAAPLAIVASGGVIVAATEPAIALLEMPPLRTHKYLETVKQDTFKPDDYSLARSHLRPVRALAETLAAPSPPASLDVTLAQQTYHVALARVPSLAWTVLVVSTP